MPTPHENRDDPGGPTELAAAVEDALTLAQLRRARRVLAGPVIVLRRADRCYLADADLAVAERAGVSLTRHGPVLASFAFPGLEPALARLRAAGHRSVVLTRLS